MRLCFVRHTGCFAGAVLFLVSLAAIPLHAGVAAPDPCVPFCTDLTLHFCDGSDEMALVCTDVDPAARCGELSPEWGADCLLPVGAACDPGYAFGGSRCDGDASLFCIDGACTVADGPAEQGPLSPTPGSESIDTSTDTGGCGASGCAQSGTALWLVALVPMLMRRKRP